MATVEQCHDALERLAGRLAEVDEGEKSKRSFDRTISCSVPDLGVTFSGELRDGKVEGISTEPGPRAQIRLTTSSDDLLAITDGELGFGPAWLGGRVKVEASVMDLLKIKSLL